MKNVVSKVERVWVHQSFFRVKLKNPQATPKDGWFEVAKNHAEYKNWYALTLAAAVNGYDLVINTENEISPTSIAKIDYLVLNI